MKNSTTWTLFAVLLLMLGSLTTAYGQITPSDDAYTNTASPTTNYGSATTLAVVSPSQTTYIRFDLSSIPAGYTSASVAKASLKLYVNAVTIAGSFNVDFVNGTWSEKTITANNAPALGTMIAASVPLAKSTVHDYLIIDITSAVGAWLNGTQANDGIALVADSPLSASFDSKENTTQSQPAELDIVFSGGTITGITTAAGSGLTGGGTSGTLNLSLLTTCAANQVLQWSGSAWSCASVKGTGTVTSVGLSAPASDFTVSGSPVTGAGTLGLSWNVAPTSANTTNAIVKRDGSGSFSANAITATSFSGATSAFSGTVSAASLASSSLASSGSLSLSTSNGGFVVQPGTNGFGSPTVNISGGFSGNIVGGAGSIAGDTVSGGGDPVRPNVASGVSIGFATVGGGGINVASGDEATVGGGFGNTASGLTATVSGGRDNIASGDHSTVPGGEFNQARGIYSFAAGIQANAADDYSFVWCADAGFECGSLGTNSFVVSVNGPIFFFDGPGGAGCNLASGGGSWNCSSDANLKNDITSIDSRSVLERVAHMPVTQWRMKGEPSGREHIGPMAQDFYAAFGLGESDRYINLGDGQGVALAAIQGLNQKLDEEIQKRDATIAALRVSVKLLRQHDAELRRQLLVVLAEVKQVQNKMEVLSAHRNVRSKDDGEGKDKTLSGERLRVARLALPCEKTDSSIRGAEPSRILETTWLTTTKPCEKISAGLGVHCLPRKNAAYLR